ncbi:pilus assembly protein [Dyella silvatica]|uniref:pilus assembly protein n=1 Tax=Dyella silvatica TaxID=2992128 RepID=UPI00224D1773|nr:PilC/PilY family type IV pilus protein [Dyella silvatica]
MSTLTHLAVRSLRLAIGTAVTVLLIGGLNLPSGVARAGTLPPTLPISQVPLTVVQPTHPQVLFAIGNSESMDGNLSGAIMTGSGSLSSSMSTLNSTSSPVNFSIPTGFTPPLNGGSGGSAPYTTSDSNGTLYDNSPSRLNVAKQGVSAILQQYLPSTDFGLIDYGTTGTTLYTTWVYEMSADGGFTFTNTKPTGSTRYILNPCYNYSNASSTVNSNCSSIDNHYSGSSIGDNRYMVIGASSDDPSINDVLYSGGGPGVYVTYGGPTPSNPYTYYTLGKYNAGGITTTYDNAVPNANKQTSPTNAGYIPFSPEVMYIQRGFGYGAQDAKKGGTGNVTAKDSSGHAIISAGQSPTSASVTTAAGYFSAALAPETNNSRSSEIKSVAGQSALGGLLTSAKSTLANSLPSTSGNCTPPKQYVVLITDGLPTEDLAGSNWPPLGSASAAGYGVTATFNTDGSLNTTNDQALTDVIAQLQALNAAGIETYVVGLGAGVDPSINPQAAATLNAMGIAGGSSAAVSKITGSTQYFPATTPAALVSDLQSILADVSSQSSSSSSAAANSTSLSANSQVYQATFSSGSSVDNAWAGDLQEFGIDANASINTTFTWSARAQLDTQGSSRSIATWDPYHVNSSSTVTPAAVGFSWSNLSATQQTKLQQNSTNGQNLVSYLRGDHSQEISNGGKFRNRQHLLGDVVDSAPFFVGAPTDYYPDTSYNTYTASSAITGRTPMLYFGANDGMLHGVNANTGKEVMAFIPNGGSGGVFSNLYMLASPYYYYHHQFFVDGSPQVDDVMLADGNWHSLLVGGENAGGSSIYALDVTNPSNFTSDTTVASSVLWEFTDTDMGLSYSAPAIVRSLAVSVKDATSKQNVNGFAVVFGNGYNSAQGRPFFYAVDASTGTQLAKIDLCNATGVPAAACSSSLPNGLSSVSVGNSSGVVGVPQDMVYAGDLQGNLWAINISIDPQPQLPQRAGHDGVLRYRRAVGSG